MRYLIVAIALWLHAGESEYLQALTWYYDGHRTNDAKAIKLLEVEAASGNVDAAFLLGVAYAQGTLGVKDAKSALKWFEKAANQGDVDAMMQVAWSYYRAQGTHKELKQAVKWFEKAQKSGDTEAAKMLQIIEEREDSIF